MSRRRMLWLALALIAAGAVALGAGFLWWRRGGLPQRQGEARIAILSEPVTVRFDAFGVPHVEASSAVDLAAAMGWLHANDRMAQLEIGRRAAAGTLAEVLGEPALPVDVHMRTLRIRRTAERMADALGPESRALLEAYSAGVNAWIEDRGDDLPPEFALMGSGPEPWEPADSLGFAVLMARDLSWSAAREEVRFLWLAELGAERMRELVGDEELEVPLGVAELAERARRERERARQASPAVSAGTAGDAGGPGGGSNAWALGGARTAAGDPLVANDPHLDVRLPGVWYQALLRSPDYEAAGMTLPGLPLVVIGQGPAVAWGFTNTELDVCDLFLEEIEDGRARRGEEWIAVETEVETIAVRGGDPVELELRSIAGRPLLDAVPGIGLPDRSVAWTGLLAFDPLQPFLDLARAQGAADALRAIDAFVCPVQNVLFASRDGELLSTVLGRAPERGRGAGRIPAPAWDPAFAWRGLKPHAAAPTVLDPPEGLLASANDELRPRPGDRPLAGDFATGHRAGRIRELLAQRDGWTPQAAIEMQGDVVSLYALEVVERALAISAGGGGGEPAERARRALAGWDGAMEPRGAAALYALFERELLAGVFGDELEAHALPPLAFHTRDRSLLAVLSGRIGAAWFDDVRTEGIVEGPAQVVAAALERAWSEGARRFGGDVAAWSYGEIHTWTLRHPLGAAPLVGRLFERGPFEVPGSATTLRALSGPWLGERMEVIHAPSMRLVADPADPDRSLAVLPGGQSGHPFDRHYDDQLEAFLALEARPLAWSEERIAAGAVSTLVLAP